MDRRRAAALLLLRRRRRRIGDHHRIWVHDINKKRNQLGDYHTLMKELYIDANRFRSHFRMDAAQLDYILALIGPILTKQHTNFREPVDAKQRLSVTLRFLACWDSYGSIAASYRLGKETVSAIIIKTCTAICTLRNIYLQKPTMDDWISIAKRFEERCNFPHCVGAIDGKHIVIQAPPRTGSMFFNYKGTFSIVLMAVVDADYKFCIIQVGDMGRASDAGIYASSSLGRSLETNTLSIPADDSLEGAPELGNMPYVIVGDAAFPLKSYLMKPYPGRHLTHDKQVYNYRLSRARRVVENAFGILGGRWRVFHRRITMSPEKVDILVEAAYILHNYLRNEADLEPLQQMNSSSPGISTPPLRMYAQHAAYDVRDRLYIFSNSCRACVVPGYYNAMLITDSN